MSGSGSDGIRGLDQAPRAEAVEWLRACCGAERWITAMADRRPFGDLETLLQAAETAWAALGPTDWWQAIEHHPRLGGGDLAAPKFDATRSLSRDEQAGLLGADEGTRAALAEAQREYEAQFGFIFLIRAAGRSAEEILSELDRRMANDLETELAVAAGELREIARFRLERLLGAKEGRGSG